MFFLGKKSFDNDHRMFVSRKDNLKVTDSFYVIGQAEIARIASYYFLSNPVVYTSGVVYDRYSIRELGQLSSGSQWLTFPLPGEVTTVEPWLPKDYSNETFPFLQSPSTTSSLAYIDKIYVLSDPSLSARIENIQRMFVRHHIPIESIDWWRLGKWNEKTCNARENRAEVGRILNLGKGLIGYLLDGFD